MKIKERSFYHLIIIAILGISYYLFFYKDLEYIDSYKDRIKQLDLVIDSLHTENTSLELAVDSLNGAISFLDKEINEQDKLLDELEKQTYEKTSTIDTLSVSELERFFSDRYGYVLRDTTQ